MKRVYVNEEWCLGCHLCEYNCAFANSGEKDMSEALKEKTIYPRIHVEENSKKICYAVSCRHCEDPICIKSCIAGAISKKDGVVHINQNISLGSNRVLAILPNAYMQGHCAGSNIAGGNETFEKAIPMNSIGFFGLHAMTAGNYFSAEEGGELYEEKTDTTLKRLFIRDNRLTGFILIGDTCRVGIYTSLIREQIPLDSVDFDILKKNTASTAFSQEKRKNMFGGVV